MKKVLFVFILSYFVSNSLFAKNVIDVDSVGDLWIFAVDKSCSMIKKRTVSDVYKSVSEQLRKEGVLDMLNYEKDHICFYHTGIHPGPMNKDGSISYSEDFKKKKSFVELLVHPVKIFNHQYRNKYQLLDDLKCEIASDYEFHGSFVSQIRICVLADAIQKYRKKGLSSGFKRIYVVTISDDGDINDQWRIDYKEMQRASLERLEEVSLLNTKYIFNSLTNSGGGDLHNKLSSYDSKGKIHVFVHSYETRQSVPDSGVYSIDTVLSIKARDGKNVKYELLSHSINGDSICFIYLDSIIINDVCISVNDYITVGDTIFQGIFDNTLKENDVKAYGSVQVLYQDSIYGAHFKKYKFLYSDTFLSEMLLNFIYIVAIIIIVSVLTFLVFIFLLRPNKVLFSLYCPDGTVIKAKRGFRSDWKDNIVSLLSVKDGKRFICNNLRNVKKWKEESSGTNEILIESSHLLNFSSDITNYDTTIDIEKNFLLCSCNYNSLLKKRYNDTLFPKLYTQYSKHKLLSPLWMCLLFLCNLVKRRYFYIVSCSKNMDVSFESCILKNKTFMLELWSMDNNLSVNTLQPFQKKANRILCDFYAKANSRKIDYIVRYEKINTDTHWYVIQLEYNIKKWHSFREARLVLYNIQNDKNNTEALMKELVKVLGSNRVDSSEFIDSRDYGDFFDISLSSCLSYVYFIDGTGKKYQQLYSPFVNGESEKMSVKVKRSKYDGYLYTSLLPMGNYRGINVPARQISDDIIRLHSSRTEIIKVCDNKINFLNKIFNINDVLFSCQNQ